MLGTIQRSTCARALAGCKFNEGEVSYKENAEGTYKTLTPEDGLIASILP